MSRKPIKLVALALLISCSLAGCNNENNSSSTGSASSSSSSKVTEQTSSSKITSTSIIKEVVANESTIEVSQGSSVLLTKYYTIEGYEQLKPSQKTCTYESSDETVATIDGRSVVGVAPGEATITVTSKEDPSKSCTIDVVVKGVFLDHELTMNEEGDDFSNEYNEETGTGSFTTTSMMTNFYTIRGINSKRWFVETDITVHEVANNDRYPKIGIFTNAYNSTNAETMVTFFLNADIGANDTWDEAAGTMVNGQDNLNWTSFGVCEMGFGGQWAWNGGVSNTIARHQDAAYQESSPITYETKFKLGVTRNGADFHIFVNGNYAFSYQLSSDLAILFENGSELDSRVGFYHYNSKVTFANYRASADDDIVNANVPKEAFKYCSFMDD